MENFTMPNEDAPSHEAAILEGGPADGLRIEAPGGTRVLQVTAPCAAGAAAEDLRVQALYIYRRDPFANGEPVRYGFDGASP